MHAFTSYVEKALDDLDKVLAKCDKEEAIHNHYILTREKNVSRHWCPEWKGAKVGNQHVRKSKSKASQRRFNRTYGHQKILITYSYYQ